MNFNKSLNTYDIKRLWKAALLLFAAAIGMFSLLYTHKLVSQLEIEERQKVRQWAEATRLLLSPDYQGDVDFLLQIVMANNTIPVILTDANGNINSSRNLDSITGSELQDRIEQMKKTNEPLEIEFIEGEKVFVYYEDSVILTKLKYYPYFQLSLIALFLVVSYFAFSYSRRAEQNQVWVGMSKETAHQLGTPISSLLAWIDYLKSENPDINPMVINEMSRDLDRLQLITERFSKVGSSPVLEKRNLNECVAEAVYYLEVRAPKKVHFELVMPSEPIFVNINYPLFAWVIENITKNAMDAMDGQGKLIFQTFVQSDHAVLDIIDNGKGVPKSKFETIFKPGFTTKKRGWGLGLSLVKRIVENYHKGEVFVKESIPNQRTVFRVMLKIA